MFTDLARHLRGHLLLYVLIATITEAKIHKALIVAKEKWITI